MATQNAVNNANSGVAQVNQTTATATLAAFTQYTNNYVTAALTVFTLPATSAVGDTYVIRGAGAGNTGWKVAQGSGQQMNVGNQATTSGATGFIESQNVYDCVVITCTTANTQFDVSVSQGNITLN